jgi:hypothetical protein
MDPSYKDAITLKTVSDGTCSVVTCFVLYNYVTHCKTMQNTHWFDVLRRRQIQGLQERLKFSRTIKLKEMSVFSTVYVRLT